LSFEAKLFEALSFEAKLLKNTLKEKK